MARYLVTGAAGFIAHRIASMLLESGHEVVGIDNLNDAYDVRMKHYRLRDLQRHAQFTFLQEDISQKSILNLPFWVEHNASFDGLINLAARAGVRSSVENPWVYLETNVTGTLNMLELCRRLEIPKFMLASTSSIYGANPPYPTPETASSDRPLQPYAASKKAAEALAHSYHYLYGLDVTIVRYFTVYGPAGRPDLAHFRFVQWIHEGRPIHVFGDGNQTRGFTYIDDIARGTIAALQKKMGYEIINLGGHEVISINQLIALIEELTSLKADVRYEPANPADMRQNWADVTKARQLLGWEPQVDQREGLRRLIAWYRAEREWAREVHTL